MNSVPFRPGTGAVGENDSSVIVRIGFAPQSETATVFVAFVVFAAKTNNRLERRDRSIALQRDPRFARTYALCLK